MDNEIIIGLFSSFLLIGLLICSIIILAVKQKKIERNVQRISLFEKRYEILILMIEIMSNVKILDNSLFEKDKEENKTLFFVESCLNGVLKEKIIQEKISGNSKLDDLALSLNTVRNQSLKMKRAQYIFSKFISSYIISFANKYSDYVIGYITGSSKDDLENKEKELKLICKKIEHDHILNLIQKELNLIKEKTKREVKKAVKKEVKQEVTEEIKQEVTEEDKQQVEKEESQEENKAVENETEQIVEEKAEEIKQGVVNAK